MTMSTINDHLARLRKHVADLTARAEAAEQEVEELTVANQTLAHMYLSRAAKYDRLAARMGLVVMCRAQVGYDGEVL